MWLETENSFFQGAELVQLLFARIGPVLAFAETIASIEWRAAVFCRFHENFYR